MTINEICELYREEQNTQNKEILKNKIVDFCNKNPDSQIPEVASQIYIEYLLGV